MLRVEGDDSTPLSLAALLALLDVVAQFGTVTGNFSHNGVPVGSGVTDASRRALSPSRALWLAARCC